MTPECELLVLVPTAAKALNKSVRSRDKKTIAHALIVDTSHGLLLIEPVLDYDESDNVYDGVSVYSLLQTSIDEAAADVNLWREKRGFRSAASSWSDIDLRPQLRLVKQARSLRQDSHLFTVEFEKGLLAIS